MMLSMMFKNPAISSFSAVLGGSLLSLCAGSSAQSTESTAELASDAKPALVGAYALPFTPIDRLNSWLDPEAVPDSVPDGSGGTINFRGHPAICSGLHVEMAEEGASDPGDRVGDAGPMEAGILDGSVILYGLTDIGVSEDCENDSDGRFLAFPDFAATIVKLSLRAETNDIVIDHVIPLLSSPGVHTISRDPRFTGQVYRGFDYATGNCSEPVAAPAPSRGLKPDDALDSEDLHRLSNSEPGRPTYVLADEFGPSIFVTDETGRIMKSYTHDDDAENLDTMFETVAIFPDILVKARRGRGFESLAVSKDERFAWTILQSSMTNEQEGVGSDMLRVYKLDISDPLAAVVVAEYLYPFAPLTEWRAIDPSIRGNRDLKVSAIDWLAPDVLLISERARSDGLLVYVADFEDASNILGMPESLIVDPLVETRASELGLALPTKDLRFSLSELPEIGPVAKMEGLRAITEDLLVMCEDADFQRPTRLWFVQLPGSLPRD